MHARIGRDVVRSLGSPSDLLQVKVYPVGSENYRVNVMVGTSAGSARVGQSYFLTADRDGNVLTSSPKIVRLY